MNLDRPLSEIFVEEGYVTRDELKEILSQRQDTTERLGDVLVRLGLINEKQNLKCQGLQMGVPFVDFTRLSIDPDAASLINHATALRLLAVPFECSDVSATVAMVDPLDLAALDELTAITKRDIDPVLAAEEDIRDAIFRVFGAYDDLGEILGQAVRHLELDGVQLEIKEETEAAQTSIFELKEVVDGAPVVKLANALLVRAIGMRASDVHIEAMQRRVRVRFRIDGLLQEIMSIPKDLQFALASRIKIIANLDIAERRHPQDGRCTLLSSAGEYDFRVSTYPSTFGENIVLRLLNKQGAMIDHQKLGLGARDGDRLLQFLNEPQGLVVVNGPTGSGKTTTLYASVHYLNTVFRHIITIEDPVEYQLEGIIQGAVNPQAGLSFATGLRAILRQDPDVILIGEIRDRETAQTAVEAALTGHLVLSSIHSNDSPGAVMRLTEMGVEPFLVGSSLTCSLAQRLVRLICPKCSEAYQPEHASLARLGLPEDHEYMIGRGCDYCARTGYRGRIGIYELLAVTAATRRLIQDGANADQIRGAAEAEGMTSMRDDARQKVLDGLTTVNEVIRVTAEVI